MTATPKVELAEVLGRLIALGTTYHVDLKKLIDRATVLASSLEQLALVAVPHTFDRVAVVTQVKREAIAQVVSLMESDQFVRVDALAGGADTTGAAVELETVSGDPDRLAVAFQALGRRVLATDLARLQRFGATIDTAGKVATMLGGDQRLIGVTDRSDGRGGMSWTLQIEQPNRDATQRAATRDRVDRAAELLGVTRAQRNMVAGLHDTFVGSRESFALVHVRPAGVELSVLWGVVPWEHVVRMMLQLYAGDAPTKLGELAGAAGTDVAAMVEVVLGATEPPAMRVTAAIGKN